MSSNMIVAQNTIGFLLSGTAATMRAQRLAANNSTVVVHCETHRGMIELDADDVEHAERLIGAWICRHGAKSARYHHVKGDGALCKPSAIFDFLCFAEHDPFED